MLSFLQGHEIIGGVDITDTISDLHDLDPNGEESKWYKKAFLKLLMNNIVNCWIICKEIHRKNELLISCLIYLAEEMVAYEYVEKLHSFCTSIVFFYSPKGYNYVINAFNKTWPHLSSLRKSHLTVNGECLMERIKCIDI